jgi:hypothetical protein
MAVGVEIIVKSVTPLAAAAATIQGVVDGGDRWARAR